MKSQAFSMDIMIAFVIFLGTIFIFYSIISNSGENKARDLQDDASEVMKVILSRDSNYRLTDGSIVNLTKIEDLLELDYEDLKRQLRIESDFCIYFEDVDGNIIYLSEDKTGIGSDKISISDIPCS